MVAAAVAISHHSEVEQQTLNLPLMKVVPDCIHKLDEYPHLQERVLRSTPAELESMFDDVSTPFSAPAIRPLTNLTSKERTELIEWVRGAPR